MQTDMSVTEIAGFVGFNTSRTFNRAFIRHMGTPPSEYRKNHSYDGFSPSLPLPVSPQTETISPEALPNFEVETIQVQN
jgi:AraC-like DNA-binding protein